MRFNNFVVALLAILLVTGVDGRGSSSCGGGRSGGFSSSSRSSYSGSSRSLGSRSSSGSSSSFGRSSRTSSSSGGYSAPTRTVTTRTLVGRTNSNSNRDAFNRKINASKRVFETKDTAKADFSKNYGTKYSTKFSKEPKVRPDYIPKTYNGAPVQYRNDLGGYGYYNSGLQQWIMYDIMSDAIMMNMLMSKNGYSYYETKQTVVQEEEETETDPADLAIVGWIFGGVIAIVIIGVFLSALVNR